MKQFSKPDFASKKFDWLNGVASHPQLKSQSVRIALVVSRFINKETGVGRCADDTLLDYLPGFSRTKLFRYRKPLFDLGILSNDMVGKLGRAHHYRLQFEWLDKVNDWLIVKKEARQEQRAAVPDRRTKTGFRVSKIEHGRAA
jgi:hypothetical protein